MELGQKVAKLRPKTSVRLQAKKPEAYTSLAKIEQLCIKLQD